jgi:hypothetical protein
MQSVDLQKFLKNLKFAIRSGQKVLSEQSPAGPDNVRPTVGPGVFKPMNRCLLLSHNQWSVAPLF